MSKLLAQHRDVLNNFLHEGRGALMAAKAALPDDKGLAHLREDAHAAQSRGYYTPVEDERLRFHYRNYLALRAGLWQSIQRLLPYIELPREFKKGDWPSHLVAFGIAFSSAALLLRTGYFLVDIAQDNPVVRDKLDEAEPRFGIERKQFTEIYDSLVSTRRMAKFASALRFYRRHKQDILESLQEKFPDVAESLLQEDSRLETRFGRRAKAHLKRKARFNLFSLKRRNISALSKTLFFLFEVTGSDIADMHQPFVKPHGMGKRVTPEVRAKLLELVQPGDVFVTRHDDAMSNLFLPGYWPHAALYIGTDKERADMNVNASVPAHQSRPGEVRFLESKKDGVLFRPADDTLQVDACVILRPRLDKKELGKALNRALSHAGKLYDFVFDFTTSDRLVCTELVYRTYDGFGGIKFELTKRKGRLCLSAEDLLNQAIGHNWFEVVALFGVGNDELLIGQAAKTRLLSSFDYMPPEVL